VDRILMCTKNNVTLSFQIKYSLHKNPRLHSLVFLLFSDSSIPTQNLWFCIAAEHWSLFLIFHLREFCIAAHFN